MARRLTRLTVTEADLTRFVRDGARDFGWERYHTHRSDFSPAGWPDEALCRPPRLILAELKSDAKTAELSPQQRKWLELLDHCTSIEVYVWRPDDRDRIAKILWRGDTPYPLGQPPLQ
jgi:hypothetical protein